MTLDELIRQRRSGWQRLEDLLQKAQGNMTALSETELQELGRLYRQATSDLALAQRDFPNQKVTAYLNQLVGRAHASIYRETPLRWQQLRRFYTTTYPRYYRALLNYTKLSFLLLVAPALISFWLVWRNPDAIYIILGPGIRDLVHTVESGKLWTDIAPSARSAASTVILTNNIQVMFLAFAGGITFGLLTLYILISNGLSLGSVFGLLQAHGLSAGLLEFILAHGFIELSVIFLAGGCGLYLGDGLLRPGLLSRRNALVQRARIAVQLILGSAPLLVLAGLIEGFISPSSLPFWFKLAVGLATGASLHWYWLRAGRDVPEEHPRAKETVPVPTPR